MKKLLFGLLFCVLGCNTSPAHKASKYHPNQFGEKDIVPHRILVDMKDDVSDNDVEELSKIAGVRLHADNPTSRKFKFEAGRYPSDTSPETEDAALEALRADPRVENAERITEYKALYTPNDPMYGDQWHFHRSGAESAWNMVCGANVVVGIIDTGVACYDEGGFHRISDLAGTKCLRGYNFIDDNDLAADDNLHGSHVASTVAESTNNNEGGAGLAYCATLLPVKVLSAEGAGSNETVAEGIRFAVDEGAQVINMSLGSHSPSGVVEDAVNYAIDHHVIVVAAAGNSGSDVGFPAAFDGVIAVSAVDEHDHIANFSSRGPEVAIATGGVNILQQTITEGGHGEQYMKLSGTSMASPGVAAAAALVVSAGITSPEAVREKLQSTADAAGDPDEYGAGILNVGAAVRSTIFNHTILRLLALAGIIFFLRKKINTTLLKSKLAITGIVLGGFGLVPLFFSTLMPRLGSFRVVAELFVRPVGEMDLVFGHGHSLLLLASAIPTTIVSLLMFGNKNLRLLAGGFGLGAMALATQIFYSNDTLFAFGSLGMRVWMAASVVVCGYFVKNAFEKKA